MQSALMQVVEQARWAFERPTPVDGLLGLLKQAMDWLDATELDAVGKLRHLDRNAGWQSEELYKHQHFQLSMFLVPQGKLIPLHGHPLMTVLMKVLVAESRIRAYDWAEEYPWSGLARPTYDRRLRGTDDTLVILPKRGNVHSVLALADCAFVDLIYPPYAEQDGRPCHYYREGELVSLGGETLVRLEQV